MQITSTIEAIRGWRLTIFHFIWRGQSLLLKEPNIFCLGGLVLSRGLEKECPCLYSLFFQLLAEITV